MEITHTDIYKFSIPMQPFTIATGTMHFAQNVFIRVHTSAGMYGVGECSAFPVIAGETQATCFELAKDFAALWKNKDPLRIEERMAELHAYTAGNSTIKSAFDMALYDISAKHAGLPLYAFLGGEKKVMETDLTIGIGSAGGNGANSGGICKKRGQDPKDKIGERPANRYPPHQTDTESHRK